MLLKEVRTAVKMASALVGEALCRTSGIDRVPVNVVIANWLRASIESKRVACDIQYADVDAENLLLLRQVLVYVDRLWECPIDPSTPPSECGITLRMLVAEAAAAAEKRRLDPK